MATRILVPFDGSASAARALDHAIAEVRSEAGADLQLLNVQEAIGAWETLFRGTLPDLRAIQAERERAGQAILEAAEHKLRDAGISWASHVRIGEPAQVIAKHAAEYHCTALVMGTRGMGLAAGMLVGSVTTKVVHLVEIPVTLVK